MAQQQDTPEFRLIGTFTRYSSMSVAQYMTNLNL